MKAEKWAREEKKEEFMFDDGYIKETGLQTSKAFSKLRFWILKRKSIAICPLPFSGTFLFRIPKHHDNAQELKGLISECLQNFSPV